MKFLVVSDIHAHNYKQFDNNGSRLNYCLAVIDWVYELCKQYDINTVLFAGDMYHSQKTIPTEVVNGVIEAFDRNIRHSNDITWFAITGNHDLATKNIKGKEQRTVSALKHLATVFRNNFILLDNRGRGIDVLDGQIPNVVCVGIPYYEFKEHFHNKFAEVSEQAKPAGDFVSFKVLMIHQTPKWSNDMYMPFDTDPNDQLYDAFDLVLCGHIHEHRKINDKFYIVGNPLQQNAEDIGKEKGVLLVDTEKKVKDRVQFISSKGLFPEFITKVEGELVTEDTDDYVMWQPKPKIKTDGEAVVAEKFKVDLGAKELLTNYWKAVDGKDKKLLSIGLSFL